MKHPEHYALRQQLLWERIRRWNKGDNNRNQGPNKTGNHWNSKNGLKLTLDDYLDEFNNK